MIKHQPKSKLTLHRQTIRMLGEHLMRGVAGGKMNQTRDSQCDCPTFTCDSCTLG